MHIRSMLSIIAVWSMTIASACEPEVGETDGGAVRGEDGGAEPAIDAGTVVAPRPDAGSAHVEADAGPAPVEPGPGAPDGGPPVERGLRVVGNQILKDGVPFQMRGVNRAGAEFSCVQRGEIFDGPMDDASIEAIAAWGANAIRIPINETCWLGINGVAPQASGANYQEAILDYVDRVSAHGLIPIIDLHWAAPGGQQATEQLPMPNRDHSPELWRQVAAAVAHDPYVVLELFNEPWPDRNRDSEAAWRCWRDGGTCPEITYQAAGMQELVDAVRSTGAENVILAGGVQFANGLSRWLSHRPHDPTGQLAAAWHVYAIHFCADTACYDRSPADVAAVVPVVATEIGDDHCGTTFMPTLLDWLDEHDAGYLAWVWNTWRGCMRLIDDYEGTPRGHYGASYRDHLRSRAE